MLHHVTLEVRPAEVEPCVAFWELLGFVRVTPPPLLADRYTWLERAGTQVHLVPVGLPTVPGEGHAAVVADDAATAVARLEAAGFAARRGSDAWDGPRWFVRDPAGHRVEIMSAPPPAGGFPAV